MGNSTNQDLMKELYRAGFLHYTPSMSYDDNFILKYAANYGGIVVSRDKFREFADKKEYKVVIPNRLLQPTFVKDDLLFPEDPLGRNGPTLDMFLKY